MFCRIAFLVFVSLLIAFSAVGQWTPSNKDNTQKLTFHGRVLDPKGAPVKDAKIVRKGGGPTLGSRTDEKGEFSLVLPNYGVGEWVALFLEVHSLSNPDLLAVWARALHNEDDLKADITLHRMSTVSGKVMGPDGQPMANAQVSMVVSTENQGHLWNQTSTDDKGVYSFKNAVPETNYEVTARADGYGQDSSGRFTIVGGIPFEVEDLTLDLADMSLEGTVVDENGKPLKGVRVGCSGRRSQSQDAESGQDGRFKLEKLVDELLDLWAFTHSQPPELHGRARAHAGDMDVEIVMEDPSSRRGRSPEAVFASLIGKEAPEFGDLPWLVGSPVKRIELLGKPILLVFLKEDAASYADTMDAIKDIANGENHVILIAGATADAAVLKKTFSKKGAPWRLAQDVAGAAEGMGALHECYQIRRGPGAFLIGADGKVQYQDLPLAAIAPAWAEMAKTK